MKYTLSLDGDAFEQKYWEAIKNLFPNYEIFWTKIITPLTCRNDFPKKHPLWIHFRENVQEDLQRTAMAHYTIFRCFATNRDIIDIFRLPRIIPDGLFAERFDMFYANMGSIVDMVSDLCFCLAKLEAKFSLGRKPFFRLSDLQLQERFETFKTFMYGKRIEDFLRTGRPVHFTIHERTDLLKEMLGNCNAVQSFEQFAQRVKTIRNAAIHNPIIGSFGNKVPKVDKMKKYYLWANLFYGRNDADFVDREKMISEDFETIQKRLNSLWDLLIPRFETISRQEGYLSLLGHAPGV
jgi:hypothetical protein